LRGLNVRYAKKLIGGLATILVLEKITDFSGNALFPQKIICPSFYTVVKDRTL